VQQLIRESTCSDWPLATPQGHFLLHYLQALRKGGDSAKATSNRRYIRTQVRPPLFGVCRIHLGIARKAVPKTPQSPSTVTVAKLLTEKRSAQPMALLEKALNPNTAPKTLNLISQLVLSQAILILTFASYQLETNLGSSRRWVYDPLLTQRPPPAF
jgi:hypothetical protein